MSMIGEYRRIDSKELEGLVALPQALEEFVQDERPATSITIDKTWHIIHFLLNDHPWEGNGPAFNVVLGGTEVDGTDGGYGPIRFLTPDQVKEAASMLEGIGSDKLLARYDPARANESKIYTENWTNSDEDKEYIRSYFEEIRKFFGQATENGQSVLLWLS